MQESTELFTFPKSKTQRFLQSWVSFSECSDFPAYAWIPTCWCGSWTGPVSLHLQNFRCGNHPQPSTPMGGRLWRPLQIHRFHCVTALSAQQSWMNLLRQGGATDCVPGRTGWGNRLCSWQDRVGQQTVFLAGQGGATDCVPGRTGWGNRLCSWQDRVGQQTVFLAGQGGATDCVPGRTGWGNRLCSWQDRVGQQTVFLAGQGGATDFIPGRTGWGNRLYSWQDRVG